MLAQIARQYGLFVLLADTVRVKVRNRDASDAETLWAIVALPGPFLRVLERLESQQQSH